MSLTPVHIKARALLARWLQALTTSASCRITTGLAILAMLAISNDCRERPHTAHEMPLSSLYPVLKAGWLHVQMGEFLTQTRFCDSIKPEVCWIIAHKHSSSAVLSSNGPYHYQRCIAQYFQCNYAMCANHAHTTCFDNLAKNSLLYVTARLGGSTKHDFYKAMHNQNKM